MNTGNSGSKESMSSDWQQAKKYAALLGFVPSSFSTTIRTMVSDHVKFGGTLRPVTKYHACRLLQGPTFKSMLYHATMELKEGYVRDQKFLSVGTMVDLFDPLDLSVMVGCYLIFRKWKKFLGKEDWNWLISYFGEESQIAAQVGAAIPALGVGAATLVGTIPGLTLGAVLKQDKTKIEAFIKLDKKVRATDKAQLEIFGCTLNQISTQLLLSLGFPRDLIGCYCDSRDPNRFFRAEETGFLPQMQMSGYWIAALIAGESQPLHKIPGSFFPMESQRKIMDDKILDIKGPSIHWLSRGKDDISLKKTPALYAPTDTANKEVPDELKQVFSMEEIEKMEIEEFDQLIDQLDFENGGKAPAGMVVISNKELSELEEMVE